MGNFYIFGCPIFQESTIYADYNHYKHSFTYWHKAKYPHTMFMEIILSWKNQYICFKYTFWEIPHKRYRISWRVVFEGLSVQNGTRMPCWLRLWIHAPSSAHPSLLQRQTSPYSSHLSCRHPGTQTMAYWSLLLFLFPFFLIQHPPQYLQISLWNKI